MSSKGFIFMMLTLVFFIPGAYSISVSLSGGDAGSSFSDVLTIGADVKDSLSVYSIVKGPALEQDASGNGNLHKSFSATNHKGENAHIIADIVNAGYWEYNQPVIFTDATSASVSGFGLTATDADSIKCTAGVSNRNINKASAIVEVNQGSLINYQADASARSDGVALSQSFDQASGDRIAVTERASNPTGYASTKTNVEDGSLFSYSNEGSTYANSQSLQTLGQFDEAIGEKIASESSAYKSCGLRANVGVNVERTESEDGRVAAYYSHAGNAFNLEIEAQQQDGPFAGYKLKILAGYFEARTSAGNRGGSAAATTEIRGAYSGEIAGKAWTQIYPRWYVLAMHRGSDVSADRIDNFAVARGYNQGEKADGSNFINPANQDYEIGGEVIGTLPNVWHWPEK